MKNKDLYSSLTFCSVDEAGAVRIELTDRKGLHRFALSPQETPDALMSLLLAFAQSSADEGPLPQAFLCPQGLDVEYVPVNAVGWIPVLCVRLGDDRQPDILRIALRPDQIPALTQAMSEALNEFLQEHGQARH